MSDGARGATFLARLKLPGGGHQRDGTLWNESQLEIDA